MTSRRYLTKQGQGPYEFTRDRIEDIPATCGVYVLYNDEVCVLAEKAKDLNRELRELFEEPTECVKQHWPTMVEVEPCRSFDLDRRLSLLRLAANLYGTPPLCGSES